MSVTTSVNASEYSYERSSSDALWLRLAIWGPAIGGGFRMYRTAMHDGSVTPLLANTVAVLAFAVVTLGLLNVFVRRRIGSSVVDGVVSWRPIWPRRTGRVELTNVTHVVRRRLEDRDVRLYLRTSHGRVWRIPPETYGGDPEGVIAAIVAERPAVRVLDKGNGLHTHEIRRYFPRRKAGW